LNGRRGALHCFTKELTMYHLQHQDLARAEVERRFRTRKVEGIRRSARLISLEIRRSRRAGHEQ